MPPPVGWHFSHPDGRPRPFESFRRVHGISSVSTHSLYYCHTQTAGRAKRIAALPGGAPDSGAVRGDSPRAPLCAWLTQGAQRHRMPSACHPPRGVSGESPETAPESGAPPERAALRAAFLLCDRINRMSPAREHYARRRPAGEIHGARRRASRCPSMKAKWRTLRGKSARVKWWGSMCLPAKRGRSRCSSGSRS